MLKKAVFTCCFVVPVHGRFRRICSFLSTIAVLLLTVCGGIATISAQTAHFSYAFDTLGGGWAAPYGVAVDGSGNVYIADAYKNSVDKMTAGCTLSSCMTSLGGGYNYPTGVAVDSSGNVYVADAHNHAVKEMPPSCTSSSCVTTLGGGFSGPSAVAVDGSGNVYVADPFQKAVYEMPAGCTSADYAATTCVVTSLGGGFDQPTGVAVDGSGNVYVADANGSAVYEMPAGCTSADYAATTCAVTSLGGGFSGPENVVVDGSGNIYVADTGNDAVKKMPAGCTSTDYIASSCTVTSLATSLGSPEGVAVDGSGNIYIADSNSAGVEEIMLNSVNFGPVPVGTASAAQTLMFTFDTGGTIGAPVALTRGAKNLDFADAGTGSCTTNGASHSYSAGGTCTVAVTFTPTKTSTRYGAVELVNNSGSTIATAYIYGTGQGPQVIFSPTTTLTLGGGFFDPTGVAMDGSGNVYVGDYNNHAVKEMPPSCTSSSCVTVLGGGFNDPMGVAVDGSGNVYVADAIGNATINGSNDATTLKEMPPGCASSGCVTTLGGGFQGPEGVAVDGSGNIYVADTNNSAVKEMPAGCASSTCVTTLGGGFSGPGGVVVDGSGNIYVADIFNNAVKEMPAGCASSTCVTTLGGFDGPRGVALDSNGDVYFANADSVNEIDRADFPSLSFVATVGTVSSLQTVMLENIGNASLTFTVPTAGQNPSVSSNFELDASATCPVLGTSSATGTLAAGASCTLPVKFAPSAAGTISGSVTITDNNLNVSNATQTIGLSGKAGQIALAPAAGALAAGTAGTAYSASFTASGGTAPYTYSSTTLPAGLTLSSAGSLSGTPTAVGSYSFTVTATDAIGLTTSQNYTLTISASAVLDFTLTNSTPSQTVKQNGTATYTFQISPTAGTYPGPVSFTAQVTDSSQKPVTTMSPKFDPASIAANDGTQTVTLTLGTDAPGTVKNSNPFDHAAPLALCFLLFPLLGFRRVRKTLSDRGIVMLLLIAASMAGMVSLSGCASPPGDYTVTVTATSGSIQHNFTATLTITH